MRMIEGKCGLKKGREELGNGEEGRLERYEFCLTTLFLYKDKTFCPYVFFKVVKTNFRPCVMSLASLGGKKDSLKF
jgi:hypothetical protein